MGLADELLLELGLPAESRNFEDYSDTETTYIKNHYLIMTDAQIGWKLGRNKFSIRMKRRHMGLDKYKLAIHTGKKVGRQVMRGEVEQEIEALVYFIETTTSEVWREIANTRRLQLLQTLKVEL